MIYAEFREKDEDLTIYAYLLTILFIIHLTSRINDRIDGPR